MATLWLVFAGALFLNGLLASLLAWRAAGLRHAPGAREFAGCLSAVAVWTVGYGLETLVSGLPAKLFWLKVENLGIVAVAPLWLLFALRHARHGQPIERGLKAALALIPLATLALSWTGAGQLHYAWLRPISEQGGPLAVGRGPWYFVHLTWVYALMTAGTLVLWRALRRAGRAGHVPLLLAGVAGPLVLNLYYLLSAFGLAWAPPVDFTPLAFASLGLFFGLGAFRLRLFDLVPVAREAVLEGLADAVLVLDRRERLADLNRAAAQLLGRAPHEVVGAPVGELLAAWPALAASASRAEPGLEEVELQGAPARRLAVQRTPLLDRRGHPAGRAVTVRDVSERWRSEQRLRDLEARWRTLLQSSPDAILICDREGRLLSVNDQAERLFGYGRGELLGRAVEELLPEAQRELHVHRREAYARQPASRPMGGTAALAGRHRDGHEVPLEISLSAIQTAEGPWVMAIAHDLTSRQQHLERIRLLGTAIEAAASAVAISDPQGRCLWVNPAFTALTGYAPSEIVGQPLSLLKSGVHDQAFYAQLWSTILAGRVWHGQVVNRHRRGHTYTEEQTIAPVWDEAGHITHFVAIKQDVTGRLRMEADLLAANRKLTQQVEQIDSLRERLLEQATRDPLTGLFNRRFLTETLERELARARRARLELAVVLLDLDHFKLVNDTCGHRAGDQLLQALAGLLLEQTRREDLVCRYGGEEFVVLMPGAGPASALARAEGWRAAVEALRFDYEGRAVQVTLSAGVATYPQDGEDEDALLHAADQALYRAKADGRNQVASATSATP